MTLTTANTAGRLLGVRMALADIKANNMTLGSFLFDMPDDDSEFAESARQAYDDTMALRKFGKPFVSIEDRLRVLDEDTSNAQQWAEALLQEIEIAWAETPIQQIEETDGELWYNRYRYAQEFRNKLKEARQYLGYIKELY